MRQQRLPGTTRFNRSLKHALAGYDTGKILEMLEIIAVVLGRRGLEINYITICASHKAAKVIESEETGCALLGGG